MSEDDQTNALSALAGRTPYFDCGEHGEVADDRVIERHGKPACPWCGGSVDRVDEFQIGDLNSIAVLEKSLRTLEWAHYTKRLRDECGGYDLAITATAAQRREALLKTKGLWK